MTDKYTGSYEELADPPTRVRHPLTNPAYDDIEATIRAIPFGDSRWRMICAASGNRRPTIERRVEDLREVEIVVRSTDSYPELIGLGGAPTDQPMFYHYVRRLWPTDGGIEIS